MVVRRFGETIESKPSKQWYELENGERVVCAEEIINILWCNWVASGNSKRVDTDEETIFEFINPVEIDLSTAERW